MATGRVPTTANSPLTAKGDLFGYSTTQARVPVGNDGETIVADSSTSTGLRYQGNFAAGKNCIYNGAMQISQRNGTTAVTPTISFAGQEVYVIDRFALSLYTSSKITAQQVTDAPAGLVNSLKLTTAATVTPSADEQYLLSYRVEGSDFGKYNWGTANAQTVTISFYVKSSLTGTFSAALYNSAFNRVYVTSYTISAANTWERKTITVAGDTSGTWLSTTGTGLAIQLGLSLGSNTTTSSLNTWSGTFKAGATGQVNLLGTLSATWQITGVQIEAGSVATAFQTATGTIQGETSACQRYYFRETPGTSYGYQGNGYAYNTTEAVFLINLPVSMRTTPASIEYSGLAIDEFGTQQFTFTSLVLNSVTKTFNSGVVTTSGSTGLTSRRPYALAAQNNVNAYLAFSAEL